MERVDVNGSNTHNVYKFLRRDEPIEWNFTKFIVGKNGQVLKRFGQSTKPKALEEQLAKAL